MVCEFFHNPLISLKSQHEAETETQVETQTRKHVHDPLNYHHRINNVRANCVPKFFNWTTILHTSFTIGK